MRDEDEIDLKPEIRCEQAYAQGKMLHHNGWKAILGGEKTASDIDFVLNFKETHRTILCELTSSLDFWIDIVPGQRWTYEDLILKGYGATVAVLCRHSVPITKAIDTVKDVESFQVMRFTAFGRYATSGKIVGNDKWQLWVPAFLRGKGEEKQYE